MYIECSDPNCLSFLFLAEVKVEQTWLIGGEGELVEVLSDRVQEKIKNTEIVCDICGKKANILGKRKKAVDICRNKRYI